MREKIVSIERKPIEAGIISRVTQGVKYMITGVKPDTWMSPNQPISPIAQEVQGRQYDYPIAQNLDYSTRTLTNVSWGELRGLADNYDLLRVAIETRKDQLAKLEWIIAPMDKKAKGTETKIQEVTDFFKFPDKFHNWDTWLRMIVEELLVIDAPTIYPRFTNGNKLFSLELMDGATIRRLIDDTGRTPLPPSPAYQQVLKGVPAVDYTFDELIYYPRNMRVNKVYGYSPVEQIIMTVNIAMRRQIYQLQYYTEGNIPDAFIGVPESWNTNQIREFQEWWDSVNSGNTSQRRKAKFIHGGTTIHETKESPLKDDYDEWLSRIICYAFSLSPQTLTKQMNRASAQTAQETSEDEGLMPLMRWIKTLIDFILLKYFGYNDIEFLWKREADQDVLKQAQVNDLYIRNGTKSVDEVRGELGIDPVGMNNAVYSQAGTITFLNDLIATPPPVPGTQTQQNESNSLQAPKNVNEKDQKEPKTQKLLKSEKKKSVLKPINRDRELVNKNILILQTYLSKFLKSQGKKIAAQIISHLKKDDAADEVQRILDEIDLQGWTVIIGDVQKALAAMGDDGADLAYMQLGGIPTDESIVTTSDALTLEYSKNRAAELVGMRYNKDGELVENPSAQWTITDSTRDMLNSTVTQALDEGWSNDELAQNIQDNFAFSDSRAETIARTEIKRADMQGSLNAYKSSGLVQGKSSVTSFDYDDDDECGENEDAGVIPIDDDFPSGDDAPPYHPNCRCDLVPELIEGESEGQDDEQETDESDNNE